ncbi:hypothetical protein QE152_g33569 [Popillia japonica]|uniref:Uncharacterized protein n=1 Tax=Popillia japonica TaxID=7064 RepID=A0AAW1IWI0_POPJA
MTMICLYLEEKCIVGNNESASKLNAVYVGKTVRSLLEYKNIFVASSSLNWNIFNKRVRTTRCAARRMFIISVFITTN